MAEPLLLYHATYRARLASVLRWGLGGSPTPVPANYEDSEAGATYFALCPDVARSYAECSDVVPEAWLSEVLVLQVDRALLDASRLGPDPNVRLAPGEAAQTLVYRGIVPPGAIREVPEASASEPFVGP